MGKGMKTNKSFSKRLKVTKNGKVIARKPGFNHFNAKQSRSTQLAGKNVKNFVIKNKPKSHLMPFS
ncbi:50S ribosomal protein L35 [Candidatus Nomurabacteria bacterium CG10_big_fil_rev_8_21_14_0_10_35_16]|uniref:50S ribosomal protein L35 n=1 Tax=Candidatus Nomurabacteria bacterium CG10_big_fil_rev_8_21_14_0_10_35_16 TaxID=1974731 RepID=A0A2H0TB88_9BACT|nr:MAG: 50S ribosomal protein L35 [Candidatus Nomurabacteria bacterium CG10_big_fil_rev_8_21_14_0_10_35_16]